MSRVTLICVIATLAACATYPVPKWTNPAKTPDDLRMDGAACQVAGLTATGGRNDVTSPDTAYRATYLCMVSKGWQDANAQPGVTPATSAAPAASAK